MKERYERNMPALTEAEQDILGTKKVLVVGCGGLGGFIIDSLARLGIGCIRAIDGDVFEESNLNRQLYSSVSMLGHSKAEVAGMRVADINPDVHMEVFRIFLNEENVEELLDGCDAAIDALDNIESRRVLTAACERMGIPCIMGAVTGWSSQAAISMPGDRLEAILYPEQARLKTKTVLPFTPPLCAAMEVSLCTKLLLGRPVETGTLYFFDLQDMDFESMKLN